MNYFPGLTNEHVFELVGLLQDDIIERYDNIEYWNEDIISEFYSNNGYNCLRCGKPIQDTATRGKRMECEECLDRNEDVVREAT